ncbi:alkaline phosphatase, partial [Pseudomonas sp. HMWF010]
MMIDRRKALALLGMGSVSTAGSAASAAPVQGGVAFEHGVASGDPQATGVILWTRVTPKLAGQDKILVDLEVAADPGFKQMVRTTRGLVTSAARDWTVKHDLNGQGLKPATDYWFRFVANGVTSPVGRTRTLAVGA